MNRRTQTVEYERLADSLERKSDYKNFGPYVSDRAWGTVREDYSESGDAWGFFPHDHARSRAYRWNEDGIGGVCNRFQNFCLSLGLWNGKDPIIKERFFGTTGNEGNHGEDVKEYYFYLDSTPTHSYMKMLYKYPQAEFPYEKIITEGSKRSRDEPEYELFDALEDDFKSNKYFDVYIEYAKADDDDILCKVTAHNRNPNDSSELHILPHLWFRNSWDWGYGNEKPNIKKVSDTSVTLENHKHVSGYTWHLEGAPDMLFCDNETNTEKCFGVANNGTCKKDGINDYIVTGDKSTVKSDNGTKVAGHYKHDIPANGSMEIKWRFSRKDNTKPFTDFDEIFAKRIEEADEFFDAVAGEGVPEDEKRVQRQAFAGVMWNKMFYHYGVQLWLDGDPVGPKPPSERKEKGKRNVDWKHLYNVDVISMPDKWEYPWYACWDTAFHTVAIAHIDPEWARRQLILMTREWYMHPNGQLPAYEWNFGDVNPPTHGWAAWRVYQISSEIEGVKQIDFLERIFQKLLLNFTWWVNRKDANGHNIFEGGFLGLDNIGVFDRSSDLPSGGRLEQADGTAWMGMYCLNLLRISLELAMYKSNAYEDMANKFFEHFLWIANAINSNLDAVGLWDEEDGFYYDFLHLPCGAQAHLKVQSFVGLIPLFAVETIDKTILEKLPKFASRLKWYADYRPQLISTVASFTECSDSGRFLLSLISKDALKSVVKRMGDPSQFLSDYGLRSLSKAHEEEPYTLELNGSEFTVSYEPAESKSSMFGGNSNWRGPIWFPVNYLMVESLLKYYKFYGSSFKIEYPVGSGEDHDLRHISHDICHRLLNTFLQKDDKRAFWGADNYFNTDEHWKDHILFYEYFHGDNGTGLGASHQTGWTCLAAQLVNIIHDKDLTIDRYLKKRVEDELSTPGFKWDLDEDEERSTKL